MKLLERQDSQIGPFAWIQSVETEERVEDLKDSGELATLDVKLAVELSRVLRGTLKAGECRNGFVNFSAVTLYHTLDEAHLRIFGLRAQKLVRLAECLGQFARPHQLRNIRIVIRVHRHTSQTD